MILRVEHIGIAVSDKDEANKLFASLLNKNPYKQESVSSEKVDTSFFRAGEAKLELLQSSSSDSAISRFITARGDGLHHIAFETDDIVSEMQRLKEEGFQLLSEKPFLGADNKLVCFIHPKSCKGVLVELCQEIRKT